MLACFCTLLQSPSSKLHTHFMHISSFQGVEDAPCIDFELKLLSVNRSIYGQALSFSTLVACWFIEPATPISLNLRASIKIYRSIEGNLALSFSIRVFCTYNDTPVKQLFRIVPSLTKLQTDQGGRCTGVDWFRRFQDNIFIPSCDCSISSPKSSIAVNSKSLLYQN